MSATWYPEYSRHSRIFRAVGTVLKTYSIERMKQLDMSDDPETTSVVVKVGRKPGSGYEVVVQSDWSSPPTCTCPDHAQGDPELRGFCKHVIAVCLSHKDLRCQVLDLLL